MNMRMAAFLLSKPARGWRVKGSILALCMVFSGVGFADQEPVGQLKKMQHQAGESIRKLPLTLRGNGPWYRLSLPMPVRFSAAHADLRDIRVVNGVGESLPYALVESEVAAAHDEKIISARVFPLYLPDNTTTLSDVRIAVNAQGHVVEVKAPWVATEQASVSQTSSASTASTSTARTKLRGWLLDLGERQDNLRTLTLETQQVPQGFQYFSIEGSEDLQHWQAWDEGQWVNLSFEGAQLEQKAIPLAAGSARYLRLMWRDPAEAPMLTGAHLISTRTQHQAAALTWSDPLPVPPVLDNNAYIWSLPLALPLDRLRIEHLPENTIAPVEISARVYSPIYSPNSHYRHLLHSWRETVLYGHRPRQPVQAQPAWQMLARTVLTRVPTKSATRNTADNANVENLQNEIALPSFPVQQLRLQWDPRGSGLGNEPPQIRVAMREMNLVFLARGNAPYQLSLGDVDATSAQLPLDTLIPGYHGDATWREMGQADIEATALTAENIVIAANVESAGTDKRKFLLWGILCAGMALLAGMVWQLLRKPQST